MSNMSNVMCPHCHHEFSIIKEWANLKGETKQKMKSYWAKASFLKENGWEAKINMTDKLMALGCLFSFVLYVVGILFLIGAADDIFSRYFPLLLLGSLVISIFSVVAGSVRVKRLKNKAEKAFNEWRLISGN